MTVATCDITWSVRVSESAEARARRLAVADMQTLVAEITKALVDEPDAVKVEVIEGETTSLRLHVSPRDLGKVIGKQGRTARSLRTILSAACMKLQQRCALDIVEAGGRPASIEEE